MVRNSIKLSLILAILTYSGCCKDKVITVEKPVIKIKEVKVPVKCKIPDVNCSFEGNDFEPTEKLLECVIQQKRAMEVCK